MKPTITILERINKNSKENNQETFTRLYRYLLRPDIYYTAYKNLYANNGAATKGINNDTADRFSETKIEEIITKLGNETYKPKAVRRTYRKKPNGKQRPIGIPTFTDKLIQEALRMVLEAVYEPVFMNCSHGFRPDKSPHTALTKIRYEFNGVRWFIEGDIKACFDNIDHTVLIKLISKKVKDTRLNKLIYKFLKAGYMEDWKYNETHSGTPQGGVISPLLANIYLHELDTYVMSILKPEFDQPAKQLRTKQYNIIHHKLDHQKKLIRQTTGAERQVYINEYKNMRKEFLKTPSKSQTDKKITYQRYADDFLIGINGNREDCQRIKNCLSKFIFSVLKMELSSEKTLIMHSSQRVRFLGYDIQVRRNDTVRPIKSSESYTKRTLSNSVNLSTPFKDKINKFILNKGVAKIKNGSFEPCHRSALIRCTDLEIISVYNAELRGICNYYGIASDFYKLRYFGYLMEYSCLKTFAGKYRSSISRVKRKFKDGRGGWCIPYETKTGRRYMYFAKYKDCKNVYKLSDLIVKADILYMYSTTTFESRLRAKVCELCGTSNSERFEIHHINKVKNLKGKALWERVMIAKRRKTIVVCTECHHKIHS
jgi:group II intron reverse transcriptase/maturase